MAIAAAPQYLGKDFKSASPGLRFGMYLPLWGQDARSSDLPWTTQDTRYEVRGQDHREHAVKVENKGDALRQACALNSTDQALMKALTQRAQAQAALAAGATLQIQAEAVAPFTTGLGNAHPLENGFAFLNPYGLPYLAGSGIKGVLRAAALELAQGEWGDSQGWSSTAIEALFGTQTDAETLLRGALSFWDVLPQVPGDKLHVELMTPHQSHYLQGKDSPHDSGSPNPITFLTVPPGAKFCFTVQCDERLLSLRDKALVGQWRALLPAAFEHAFAWLGFGAKTAVGYGAMVEHPVVRAQRLREEIIRSEQAIANIEAVRMATLSPEDQAWDQIQPELESFRNELAKAKLTGAFNPGGAFNQTRLKFVQTASSWTESRSRVEAGNIIESSASRAWGRPSNKERWQELQNAIAALKNSL